LNTTNHFFATCSKGVEDLVQKELEQVNITQTKLHTGGVAFSGDVGVLPLVAMLDLLIKPVSGHVWPVVSYCN